jgi:hypothetical protein
MVRGNNCDLGVSIHAKDIHEARLIRKLMSPHKENLAKKKIRGKHAYFRRLARNAASLPLPQSTWFDAHHDHHDEKGYGNLGWPYRRKCLKAMGVRFMRWALQCERTLQKYQIIGILELDHALCDAVYVHTPNPHTSFRSFFRTNVVWDAPALKSILEPLLGIESIRVGYIAPDCIVFQSSHYGVQE